MWSTRSRRLVTIGLFVFLVLTGQSFTFTVGQLRDYETLDGNQFDAANVSGERGTGAGNTPSKAVNLSSSTTATPTDSTASNSSSNRTISTTGLQKTTQKNTSAETEATTTESTTSSTAQETTT